MRVRFSHFLRGFAAIFCLLAAASNAQLLGVSPRPGKSIEFSDPKPETEVTNVNRLTRELNAQLEDQSAPDGMASHFGSGSDYSLQGVLPAPIPYAVSVPSAARDRQSRDWMDPNADWTSLAPDDLLRQFALKNILRSPGSDADNARNRSRNMTETVYERMLDNRTGSGPWAAGRDIYSARSTSQNTTGSSPGPGASPSVNEIFGAGSDSALARVGGRPDSVAEMLGLKSPSGWGAPDFDRQTDTPGRGPQVDAYQNLLNGVYESRPAIGPQESRPFSGWQSSSAAPATTVNPFNPYTTLPGTMVNPALQPPQPPRAPVPASLAPAPYNPEPEPANNNMLLHSPTFDAARRPF